MTLEKGARNYPVWPPSPKYIKTKKFKKQVMLREKMRSCKEEERSDTSQLPLASGKPRMEYGGRVVSHKEEPSSGPIIGLSVQMVQFLNMVKEREFRVLEVSSLFVVCLFSLTPGST